MTRTTKAKTTKDKRAPGLDDPAVVAGKEAAEAKAAWLALPDATQADEQTPEYKAAEKRSEKADDAFSAAPVTSLAGALTKLRALGKDITEDSGLDAWELGHVKTVTAFLEGFAGETQAEPLIELWAEQNRLVALGCVADIDDHELDALGDKLSAIEHQIANTEARTLAGVVVQIKLRESVLGHDHWVLSAALTRNVVTALERMGGGVVTKPDPVVTMSAEWGAIYDEMTALSAANPENKSGENMDRWEAALERVRALEARIIETPATSIAGVAIKLRIATDWLSDSSPDLSALHATPAREIDYEKVCIVVEGNSKPVISALIDAERLAGVS